MISLLYILPLAVAVAQVDLTLVQGGNDATPPPRTIVPSKTTRLQDHTRRHRELPNVIFAPVEGSRVLTKTAFINANSKETNDEAFKIYEHFLATRGQSVLAQVADPFYVTLPPERTTIRTPSEREVTRRHPFDSVGLTTTTLPTFTMATVVIQENAPRNESHPSQHLRQLVASRSLRREEQRYPSEARPIVRPRMVASPSLGHQASSANKPPQLFSRDIAPTALPLARTNLPLQFATAGPTLQEQQQLQQQFQQQQQQQQLQQQQQQMLLQQQQQQFLVAPPLIGFPQAVQSPFRAQFAPDQQFVPDLRNPDEVAWANYLTAKYNEQARRGQFRPEQPPANGGAGSFIRNRQPTRPIPLNGRMDFTDPDVPPTPMSPFEEQDPRRSIPTAGFAIDEAGDVFDKPSGRLRNHFARFPPEQMQQPFLPQQQFVQQPFVQSPFSVQPFFITQQQLQQQQQRQLGEQQVFIDRTTHNSQRLGMKTRTTQTIPTPSQVPIFTTPPPFLPQTTNAFYTGPGRPFQQNNIRREIAPSPTLISPQAQFPFGAAPNTGEPNPFAPPLQQQPQFLQPQPQPTPVLPNPLDPFNQQPQQPPPAFAQPHPPPQQPLRSALSPNQKLDSCCRKQGVNPVCQNLCNFDSFNDKTLVGAFLTGQCPGDQMGKAFDCASTKADHNECCMRGGLGTFLGGKCLPFCNTHKDTPANVLEYIPCLQVFRVIRDCFQEYQRVNPNIFGD